MRKFLSFLLLFIILQLSSGTTQTFTRRLPGKQLRPCGLVEEKCCEVFAHSPNLKSCNYKIFQFRRGDNVKENMLGVKGTIHTLIQVYYGGNEGTRCACRKTVDDY